MRRQITLAVFVLLGGVFITLLLLRGDASNSTDSKVPTVVEGYSPAVSRNYSYIHGTIRTLEKTSVSGAQVCLRGPQQASPVCVVSDRLGLFSFTSLLPGQYVVEASYPNYAPEFANGGRPIALDGSDFRDDIDIVFQAKGVKLEGVVKDISGGVVAGAWIRIAPIRRQNNASRALGHTTSNREGHFSTWVAQGSHLVKVSADGYSKGVTRVHAPGFFVNISLIPESILSGRVRDGAGEEVASITVSAQRDGAVIGTTLTDESGNFQLNGLPPSRYSVHASGTGYFGQSSESVLLGLAEIRNDIAIIVHPAFSVSGQVLFGDTPCGYAEVLLTTEVGRRYSAEAHSPMNIVFTGIPPGKYQPHVYCDGQQSYKNYEPILITDHAIEGITWGTDLGKPIFGLITTPAGTPISDVWVYADALNVSDKHQTGWRSSKSDESGQFELWGFESGDVTLTFQHPTFIAAKRVFPVKSEGRNELTVQMKTGASLTGTVLDEEDLPIKDLSIKLTRRDVFDFGENVSLVNDSGKFSFSGLLPGVYMAKVEHFGQPISFNSNSAKSVELKTGEDHAATFTVTTPNRQITGRVVDENGLPIRDAFIGYEREKASDVGRLSLERIRWQELHAVNILTDIEGKFTIGKLETGMYAIRAFRRGGGEASAFHVQTGTQVTLAVENTSSLTGSLVAQSGEVSNEFRVQVRELETRYNRTEYFYQTGGAWALRDLPAGNYTVTASTQEKRAFEPSVAIGIGGATPVLNLVLPGTHTIMGQILGLESENPVPNMRVSILLPNGDSLDEYQGSKEHFAVTGLDGKFSISDVQANLVLVRARSMDLDQWPFGDVELVTALKTGGATDVGQLLSAARRVSRETGAGNLGYETREITSGFEVTDIRENGPAEETALNIGDIIVAVDGQNVLGQFNYLYQTLSLVPPDTQVELSLNTGEKIVIKSVKIVRRRRPVFNP